MPMHVGQIVPVHASSSAVDPGQRCQKIGDRSVNNIICPATAAERDFLVPPRDPRQHTDTQARVCMCGRARPATYCGLCIAASAAVPLISVCPATRCHRDWSPRGARLSPVCPLHCRAAETRSIFGRGVWIGCRDLRPPPSLCMCVCVFACMYVCLCVAMQASRVSVVGSSIYIPARGGEGIREQICDSRKPTGTNPATTWLALHLALLSVGGSARRPLHRGSAHRLLSSSCSPHRFLPLCECTSCCSNSKAVREVAYAAGFCGGCASGKVARRPAMSCR